jgi:hypothetical protein
MCVVVGDSHEGVAAMHSPATGPIVWPSSHSHVLVRGLICDNGGQSMQSPVVLSSMLEGQTHRRSLKSYHLLLSQEISTHYPSEFISWFTKQMHLFSVASQSDVYGSQGLMATQSPPAAILSWLSWHWHSLLRTFHDDVVMSQWMHSPLASSLSPCGQAHALNAST